MTATLRAPLTPNALLFSNKPTSSRAFEQPVPAPQFGATVVTKNKISIYPLVKTHGDIFFLEDEQSAPPNKKPDGHSETLKKLEDEMENKLKQTTVLEGSLVRSWLARGRHILIHDLSPTASPLAKAWVDDWIARLQAANESVSRGDGLEALLKVYREFQADPAPTMNLSPDKEAIRNAAYHLLSHNTNLLGESHRGEGWALTYSNHPEDTMNSYDLRFDTHV